MSISAPKNSQARGGGRPRGQRGFTVLEIVIVLSLVGVMLAMAAIQVRGAMLREETDGWVRAIVYDIAAGQQAAMTQRSSVIATFYSNRTYDIVSYNGIMRVLRRDTLPSHMSFGVGPTGTSVTFDRRGVPSTSLTLDVTSTSGKSYTITVESGTGRVSYRAL